MNKSSVGNALASFIIRYRMPLSAFIFILLIVEDLNEGIVPRDIVSFRDSIGIVGLALVIIGNIIRSWAAGIIRKTKSLATSGPYSISRHPLYLGSLFLALGFSLILLDGENLLVVALIAAIIYVPKIRAEERLLKEKFPNDWVSYVQMTGLFFPKARPTLRSTWSFRQWLNNREYQATLTSVGAIVSLILWREFY